MKQYLVTSVLESIAAASAAYLICILPELVTAEPNEAHQRLKAHFEAAIRVYFEALENWQFPTGSAENREGDCVDLHGLESRTPLTKEPTR